MATHNTMKTYAVAFTLCIVCSFFVSSAAVLLKPRQIMNRELDIKKNLLLSSGLLQDTGAGRESIQKAFRQVEAVLVDLQSGELAETIDPDDFEMIKAAWDPVTRYMIPVAKDKAKIKTRAKYARVYFVKTGSGIRQTPMVPAPAGNRETSLVRKQRVPEDFTLIILPVYGKGLWSTLYGFLALEKDTLTVRGLTFYQHGETPGMGGEVDNPKWRAQWPGKTVFDEDWRPNIRLVKGGVNPALRNAIHQVDALSGATFTSRGVENLLHYWLGEDGFGPFLDKLRRRHNGQGGTE